MSRPDQNTILLVENEALASMSRAEDLENFGYSVIRANSGEQAIEMAGNTPGIDLILMDMEPGGKMDGAQVAGQILEKQDLPIVFILSSPDPETLEKVELITSYGFVTRNSSAAEVNFSIRMALRLYEAKMSEDEAREQLRKKDDLLRFYRLSLDGMDDYKIAVVDCEYRYKVVSRQYMISYDLLQEEILGKTVAELMGDDVFTELLKPKIDSCLEGNHIQYSEWFDFPVMGKRFMEVSYYPLYVEDQKVSAVAVVVKDITNRKHSEERFANEAARRRILMEQSRDGIVILDQDGQVYETNRKFADMLGYPIESMHQLHVWDWDAQWTQEQLLEMIRQVDDSGDHFETAHRRKDGTTYNVEISTNGAILDGRKYVFCVCRDITRRKLAEDFNRKYSERVKKQRNLIARLTFEDSVTNSSVDDALKIINTKLAATLHVERVSVWLLSQDEKKLQRRLLYDVASGSDSQVAVLNTADIPSYFEALRKDSQVDAEDAQNDMRTKELKNNYLLPLQISSLLDSVIQQDGRLMGVLSVEHRGSIRKWHDDEKSFLSAITNLVAQLFANAERKRAEEALRTAELRQEKTAYELTENIPVGTYTMVQPPTGGMGKFEFMSSRFLELTGLAREEMASDTLKAFASCLHPDDFDNWVALNAKAQEEIKPFYGETRIIVHGEIRWVSAESNPRVLPDGSTVWEGVLIDITERKQAEEALRRSENLFRKVFDILPIGLWIADKNGKLMQGNPAGVAIWGAEPKVAQNEYGVFKARWALSGEEIAPQDWALARTVNKGETIVDELLEIDAFDGKNKIILNYTAPVLDEQGNVEAAIVVNQDITSKYHAEEALRENEQKLSSFLNNMTDVAWSVTYPDMALSYISPSVEKLYGRTPDEFYENPLLWQEMIHPDDQHFNEKALFDVLKKGSADRECRVLRPDGRVVWILDKSKVIYDDNNKPIKIEGIVHDITDRKRAEEALDQERTLLRTIIDSIPDSIFVTDTETRKRIANKADLQKTGFEKEEDLAGKNVFDIWPSEIAEPLFEDDQKILKHGEKVVNREEKLIMPDGSVMWQLVTKLPIYDQTGNITGLVGIGRDITKRKRAEEEMKKQLSEKEIILKEVNHRIKNNFGTVESLLQLQTQSIDHPETQSALQDAVARVQSMRVLYEQLLISDEQEELSVKHYIESLADSIVASFPGADRITMEKQIADFSLASNRLFNVGIMINELLTNAMKYAFRDKETGRLMVSVGKVDKLVTLTVQDDGNGLPEGFDASQSEGFGLMLVRMISQQFNGSFDMENANGTRCRIEFDV